MQDYFSNVMDAEKMVFGLPCFLPSNVKSLSLKSGNLNKVDMDILNHPCTVITTLYLGAVLSRET